MEKCKLHQIVYKETKTSLRISLPLIASYLIQGSSGFAGTVMLAHLGANTLAAGALAGAVYMTILIFLLGLLSAVSVLVAQSYGAQDQKSISIATAQGFYVFLITIIPISIILWWSPVFLKWAGQNSIVITSCVAYLHASIWSLFTIGFLVVIEQFLIGITRTRLVLMISLVEVPLEIFFSYAFIFGKWGFPKLGISGLCYGYAFVFVIMIIVLFIILRFARSCRRYHIFSELKKLQWKYILEIFRVGIPIGLMYITEVAFYTIISFLMGFISVNTLDAYQIVQQYAGFTFMIILGMSQTVTIQVGQAVGRKDRSAIQRAAYIGEGLSLFMMSFVVGFYFFFPKIAIGLDINLHNRSNHTVIHLAVIFFMVMACAQLGDTVRFIAVGALRGIKDTKTPLIVSAITFWMIGLPLGYWAAFKCQFGGAALWGGSVIAIVIGAVILWRRFIRLSSRIDLNTILTANT